MKNKIIAIIILAVTFVSVAAVLCGCSLFGGGTQTYRCDAGDGTLKIDFGNGTFNYQGYTITAAYSSTARTYYATLTGPTTSCSGTVRSMHETRNGMEHYVINGLGSSFLELWIASDRSYLTYGGLRFSRQ